MWGRGTFWQLLFILVAILVHGCGCSGEGLEGSPDVSEDPGDAADVHEEDEVAPDVGCWDRDGDGYLDEACGGDDCDDAREDVYPGASEVCLDGVDQDCDGMVDGPVAVVEPVVVAEGGYNASMVWTGSEFVVTWTRMYDPPVSANAVMARLDLEGRVIGEVIHLAEYTAPSGSYIQVQNPNVAWTGSSVALAYAVGDVFTPGVPSELDVRVVLASPAGEVIWASPRLNDVDTQACDPDLAWTGSEFGVVWEDGRHGTCASWDTCETQVYFTRLDSSGTEVGSESRVTSTAGRSYLGSGMPLWTGSEFLVAWSELGESGTLQRYYSRISPEGEKVGEDVASPAFTYRHAWTGSEVGALSWDDSTGSVETCFSRLDPAGRMIDEPVQITEASRFSGWGHLAWTGSSFAVVWSDARDTDCEDPLITPFLDCHLEVYLTLVDAGGTELQEDARMTSRDTYKAQAQVTWTGSELGLVWMEQGDAPAPGDTRVLFTRVSFCE